MISHTLVTGGSVVCFSPLPALVVGVSGVFVVLGVGVGDAVALDGAFDFVAWVLAPDDDLPEPVLADVTAGVACGVTGGGWTVALLALVGAPRLAIAAMELSTSGMRSPASEVSGAGPIAAPTATPIASIPAASAAATRGEGRRGGAGDIGGSGVGMSWVVGGVVGIGLG